MSSGNDLESSMPDVREFDLQRTNVQRREREGRSGVRDAISERKFGNDQWFEPRDLIEQSLLLSTFPDDKSVHDGAGLAWDTLAKLSCQSFFTHLDPASDPLGSGTDNVPVLRSGVMLLALTEKLEYAFSQGAIGCYSRIVYEIYKTEGPDIVFGGATAGGRSAQQNAFITFWCIRAMLALENAAEQCCSLAKIGEASSNQSDPSSIPVPTIWKEEQRKCDEQSIRVTLGAYKAVLPEEVGSAGHDQSVRLPRIREFLENTARSAIAEISGAKDYFERTRLDPTLEVTNPYGIDQTLHSLNALAGCLQGPKRLSEKFSEVAKEIQRCRTATLRFMESVLDHELVSAGAQSSRTPDAAEMIFAALGLAMLGRKRDPRLRKAVEVAVSQLTPQGRLPSHKPIDSFAKGYVLHVATAEVLWALAELVECAETDVSPDLTARMIEHFEETWDGRRSGWYHEREQVAGKLQPWLTALSCRALGAIERLLDSCINRSVLRNLSKREPRELPLGLDELFYPDYGLAAAKTRKESLAPLLQRMRAHVLLGSDDPGRLVSLVLHGPPGTGKTTMPEALAKSCGVPLVEVTPSDILVGGVEQIETRARVLFEGLSLLTRVVILFDEFDSILWSRESPEKPEGVLRFVLPGMLPKLKNLYDKAKGRRVAFLLSTNLIGGLDKAAIREGRFDAKCAVFPPDPISAYGRLATEVNEWRSEIKGWASGETDPAANRARLADVVCAAQGRPMTRLGRPGWFTRPGREPGAGSPFDFLRKKTAGSAESEIDWPPPEKQTPQSYWTDYQPTQPPREGRNSTVDENLSWINPAAAHEWAEWYFLNTLGLVAGNYAAFAWDDNRVNEMMGQMKDLTDRFDREFAEVESSSPEQLTKRCEDWKETCDKVAGNSRRGTA